MEFCGVTDKGIVRKQNQDVFLAEYRNVLNAALLVVCDGMGGAKGGSIASSMALELFSEKLGTELDAFADTDKVASVMKRAIIEANAALYEKNLIDPACAGMGTTMVAALAADYGTVVVNVGDSRAYHITRTKITQITKDHSVVENLIDRGDITRTEAKHHPNKNLITRALGTAPSIVSDAFFPKLKRGDYLLLCSDGLTNLLSDQEIFVEVKNSANINECCEKLIKLAIVRGAPDNVTAVLLRK